MTIDWYSLYSDGWGDDIVPDGRLRILHSHVASMAKTYQVRSLTSVCFVCKFSCFWSAAALIVAQVHQILKPSGYAIWVCKDFVRNKKRVPFSDQWQTLCETHGFVTVERVRAWVVEDHGVQVGMFGGDKELKKERKSFFRRLAEKNGSPRIDWEDVIVMRKECL